MPFYFSTRLQNNKKSFYQSTCLGALYKCNTLIWDNLYTLLASYNFYIYNFYTLLSFTIVWVAQKVMFSCKLQVTVLAESLLSWHDPSF